MGKFVLYYECPVCKKLFKYSLNDLGHYGEEFGKCPICSAEGVFIKEGAITKDDLDYEEV
ncbi:MAG: hypothetical protein IJG31_07550 [Fusobacterium sp.]|nr:hypothetical protein [Fusobacterium sp.]